MSGPSISGETSEQSIVHDEREWTWHAESSTWRPSDPQPFEMIKGLGDRPTETYWEPVLKEWVSLKTLIDDDKDTGIVVRSYDEDELK